MDGQAGSLIGREAELRLLDSALADAAAGRPRAVVVSGEAGIGKTALVAEAGHRARQQGFAVGLGACVDLSTGLPHLSLRFAMADLVAHAGPGAAELIGRHGQELAMLLGSASSAVALAPQAARGTGDLVGLLDGLLGLLDELGGDRPVMLVLEDVQWIDPATRDLLGYLIRQLTDQRLALMLTYRRDEVERGTPEAVLWTEIQRLPFVERVELAGLDEDAVGDLARQVLEREPDPELVAEVTRRSGGNPFFAAELLVAEATRPGQLPASIREVVERRLDDLPPAAADLVSVVAALGRPAPLGLLSTLVSWSDDGLDEAMRQGVDAGVLDYQATSDEVAVRHALLAETAYERLLPSARRRLHSAIAAELGEHRGWLDPSIVDAVVAHHHERCGELTAALAASIKAARRSVSRFAFADAVVHFRRAVQMWDRIPDPESATDTDLLTVLLEAADAAHLAGEEDAGLEFVEVARRLVNPRLDPAGWAAVARREVEARWLGGDMAGALTVAETASQALAEADAAQDAWFEERRAGLLLHGARFAEARDVAAEVRELGRELGDAQLEAGALLNHGVAVAALGDVSTGLEELAEARRMGLAMQDPELTARTTINQLLLLLAAGRLDEARAVAAEGLRLAGELGFERSYVVPLVATLATSLFLQGEWDEADRILSEAPRPAWVRDLTYLSLARALLAMGRGRLEDAERWLADASIDESGNVLHGLHRAATVAEFAVLRGNGHEAVKTVEEWLPVAAQVPDVSVLRLVTAGLGALADELDSPDRAARLDRWLSVVEGHAVLVDEDRPADAEAWHHVVLGRAAELRAGSAAAGTTGPAAPAHVSRPVGVAGVDELRQAVAAFDACRFVVRAAEVRADLADRLLAAGDTEEAQHLAAEVSDVSHRVGAELLFARSEALLARIAASTDQGGAQDATALAAASLGLTLREVEVLRLVAEGHTNREIGERLYISTKTASVHVSNILRKLDAANRSAAAAAARRAGLVG